MFKKVKKLIIDPGSCVNNRDLVFRKILKIWFKFAHFNITTKKSKKREIKTNFFSNLLEQGYAKIELNPLYLTKALKKADEIINNFYNKPVSHFEMGSSKEYYYNILSDPYEIKEFIDLASEENLILNLSRYFEEVPICDIGLFYSKVKDNNSNIGSQLFHMDYDDEKTVKLYIPINGIGNDYGDLCALNKNDSKDIKTKYNYKFGSKYGYLKDEILEQYYSKIYNVEIERGDAFIFDSTKCFHRGSRKSKLDRWTLVFNYTSPHSFTAGLSLMPFVRKKRNIKKLSNLNTDQQLLFNR